MPEGPDLAPVCIKKALIAELVGDVSMMQSIMGNWVWKDQKLRVYENLYFQENPVSDQSFVLLEVHNISLRRAVSYIRSPWES